jgi:hypothetical protein
VIIEGKVVDQAADASGIPEEPVLFSMPDEP